MVFLYVTLNTLEEGQRLAALLMARQLTNCVNVHPMTCTYLWEGKITTSMLHSTTLESTVNAV
ncbi:MAG TPA: divalent cation tolerance protein CutA [Candidatus Tectomicrobia bacterium]